MQIKNEYLRVETSSRLAGMYADTVIPRAKRALDSSLAAYQAGAVDIMALLSNFLTLLESELSYHEQTLVAHVALARLEALTGAPWGE